MGHEGAVALFASSARAKQLYAKEGLQVIKEISMIMGGDDTSIWHTYRLAEANSIH